MGKILWLTTLLMLSCTVLSFAAEFVDVEQHGVCQLCGMDREKFAHSRMLIEYDDGSSIGLCSLHCTALDLSNNLDKTPVSIWVADYDRKQLINAEKAFWVLGGDRPGVMTGTAKWAIAERARAEAFQTTHGGELVGFEAAIKAAYGGMYQDTRMIREKRKMKRMMNPD